MHLPSIQRGRRGMSLMFTWVCLLGMLAVASLALDWGRVVLVKYELQAAADSAARAAAMQLYDGVAVAQAAAVEAAGKNTAHGTSVVLGDLADQTAGDFVIGNWDPNATPKFTPLTGAARVNGNAVQVTARRVAARGTGIEMLLSRVFGLGQTDVTATAIAKATPLSYGVIGLDYIQMSGNSTTSYWSNGKFGSTKLGNIASNGNITLNGSSYINGHARPGVGGSVSNPAKVSGMVKPLTTPLSYPNLPEQSPSLSWVQSNHDNWQMTNDHKQGPTSHPSLSVTKSNADPLAGGIYYVNNFNIGSSGVLNLTGPAVFYVTGNLSLSGKAMTNGNIPMRLVIIMCNAGTTVNVGSSSSLYAAIYAPRSPITLSGNGDIYGFVLGKSINMTGSSTIHYDVAITGNDGTITLEQ